MLRQVSSRNQRGGKGLRVKHVFQISLLLAISVWLLYQIMHPHDKKSAYEGRNPKSSQKLHVRQDNIFKYTMTTLPQKGETGFVTESTKIKKEVDEEVWKVEQENKPQESEDGGGGRGNNEIDERGQEKVEEEADHGKEIADEDDTNEDMNGQIGELDFLKYQEHEEVSHEDTQVKEHEERFIEAQEMRFKGDDASRATQAKEHEERSHEAQEMRFKGDDASSAVAHDAQVTEHEVGSYEEREKSFKDDDASSAVEHDIQVTESKSENGGSEGVNEKQLEKRERKEIENEAVADEAIDGLKSNDSSAAGSDFSDTHISNANHEDGETTPNNYLTRHGNAVKKRESDVGAYHKPEGGSSSSSTTGKSNGDTEQQADLPTVNATGNQTELHMNSKNNEMERQTTSSTVFSHKREPQMNSTSVSGQSEPEINMKVIDTVTNGVPLQNESATLESVHDRNATVEMVTRSENKPNLGNTLMEQTENFNTTAESGTSSHNVATQGSGDAHTDRSAFQDIKTRAESGGEEAAE